MKKKIGISFSEASFQNYWDWFTPDDLGNEIELILLSHEQNNAEDIARCDGFVLTGGIDVDPSFYNAPPDYENGPPAFNPGRDRFEREIYNYSQIHKLPVLGVCRGLQLINILEGGSLIQDLKPTGNKKHRKEEKDKEHPVTTEEGTLLFEISGASGFVNSAHHQAADPQQLGSNLKISAYADDNTVEGLEFDDKSGKAFMLCVQWHPERMKEKELNPFSQKIKERFLKEIKNS